MKLSEEEVFEIARKTLRENFGNIIGVKYVVKEGDTYKFKLATIYQVDLGYIEVDSSTGEVRHPNREEVIEKIKAIRGDSMALP